MGSKAQQELVLVEQASRIMATGVSIHLAVAPAEEAQAEAAIADCLAWLREVEQRLTRFDPTSELCQLNDAAGHWKEVSEIVFAAVREAIGSAQASDGLFDPALLAHLEALGYDRDFSLLAQRSTDAAGGSVRARAPLSAGMWREIKLDPKRRRIRLPAGARLDLGGIAKGWAADRAIERLLSRFANVIVNVGGDLHMRGGPRPGESWAVGIRDPRYDHLPDVTKDVAIISFGHGGLATSGATRRWWYHGGELQHHLLDPRTGRPADIWIPSGAEEAPVPDQARLIATATALAPTAARAEVAAKVALLRGYPDALQRVERAWSRDATTGPHLPTDTGVALLLVLGTGEVILSANMEEYLERCGARGMIWT